MALCGPHLTAPADGQALLLTPSTESKSARRLGQCLVAVGALLMMGAVALPAAPHLTSDGVLSHPTPLQTRTMLWPFGLFSSKRNGRSPVAHTIENPEEVRKVADANTKFTSDLYMKVKDLSSGNMVVSPFGVSTTIGLASLGTTGTTSQEIHKALRFPPTETLHPGMYDLRAVLQGNENYTLSMVSKMYVQQGYTLLPSFTTPANKYYQGSFECIDFGKPDKARHSIDTSVAGQTRNKIMKVMPANSLNADSRLVLVNAIYFKGSWANRFDLANTKTGTFHLKEGKSVAVPMMQLEGSFRTASIQRLDSVILEMPYKGNRLSLILILPNDRYGLSEVENNLPSFDLNQVNTKLMMALKRKVSISLPRFKIHSSHDLVAPLQQLGMPSGTSADFSSMSDTAGLHISEILQTVSLSVNEEGSVGSTGSTDHAPAPSARSAGRGPSPPYDCDHPFLFVVKDKLTRMILFAGRVTEPELA